MDERHRAGSSPSYAQQPLGRGRGLISDSPLRWAATALGAGLALAGGMLALRLATGVPSLPEIVQDRLLELLPGRLTGYLIDTLQFRAKPLLLVGWIAAQTLAVALMGTAFGSLVHRRPALQRGRGRLAGGIAVGMGLWAVVELAVLPAFGLGALGRDVPRGPESAAWTLVAFVGYGLILAGYALLLELPVPRGVGSAGARSRRRALSLLLASGAASLAGATVWRIVDQMGEHGTPRAAAVPQRQAAPAARAQSPAATAAAAPSLDATAEAASPTASAVAVSTETPLAVPPTVTSPAPTAAPIFEPAPGISAEITPNDQFYVVTKNLVDPTVRADSWALEVTGLVNRPQKFSYQEILALPTVDQYTTLECISNTVGGNLISNARWTGVPLAQLLELIEVRDDAAGVVFASADNYKESLVLAAARQRTVLLAHAMNGQPLSEKHGFPLRLLTTGLYGMKNPKWLTRIEVVGSPITGTWERSGWDPNRGVETMARFDTRPERVPAGAPALLGGVAFSGDRGVSRVEVSTDGGATWEQATLRPPLSPFTWVLWSFGWIPGEPGSYTLLVRAVDGQGTPQKERKKLSYATGATGYHMTSVRVE